MQIENGIVAVIQTYNFMVEHLVKDDVRVRVTEDSIEFTQDGRWVMLPEFLQELIIVPKGFKSGKIKARDLIKLYDSLAFIAEHKGRVQDPYMESYISPEVFGFTIWSRYPRKSEPGVKKIQTFKFNVRNKLGFKL